MNTYASKNQMVELGTSLLKALVDIEDAPKTRVQELIENPAELKDIARGIVSDESVAVTVSEPTRRWREQDSVIYFALPATDGTTGPEWIERLEKKGFRLSKWAKDVLGSKDFKPTTGVVNEIAVLKGMLFEDDDRITKKIRAEADTRKLSKPNVELACLIREKFTDKEIEAMGLWYIVAMHEPIKDSDGDPNLLDVDRGDVGSWLYAHYDNLGRRWSREDGFAFVVSQVGSQS